MLKLFGENYIFKHVGEKSSNRSSKIMKNNTGSKLTIKVSTCLEDKWLIKIQNIERREFVFPKMKPQNKTTLDFSKMDKNKNVQNGFLRDYLFFLKKKFQKF